jgi:lipopolysaccharide transport system permease protein
MDTIRDTESLAPEKRKPEQEEKDNWTEVLVPTNRLFDLKLKELWQYHDLLLLFVKRDFIATYKQTILGPIWHIIQPLLTTIMFLIVFGRIAGIPTDGIEPILFYMSSITIWNYFAACLTGTSNTFVSNAAIFGKVYFPRLVTPLSVVLSNLVKFGVQFLLLLAMIIYYAFAKNEFYFGVNWLLIPPLILLMGGLSLGLGIIISSVTTKYRDFAVLLTFGVQLLMYASPVAYPLSFLADKKYAWVMKVNPLTSVLEGFRFALFNKGSFDGQSLAYSALCVVVFLFGGVVLFNRVEKNFMDTV